VREKGMGETKDYHLNGQGPEQAGEKRRVEILLLKALVYQWRYGIG
jgi:hypothetical protein